MYNNPYYTQPQQRFQNMDMITPQYIPQIPQIPQNNNTNYLLGKSVDSVDVVRAMDIPLDGSTSYFPLTDGSAIVTKKLLNDGTSKTTIYKPVAEENVEQPKYITLDEVKELIPDIDLSELDDLKDELKSIRKQLKEIKDKR